MGKKQQDIKNVELMKPLNSGDSLKLEDNENEDAPRVAWDSKLQYFFMVISYAVGLGNVWRFPYLCQQHGGGTYILSYNSIFN